MGSSKGTFGKLFSNLFGKEAPPEPKPTVNPRYEQPPFHADALEWAMQNAALAYSGISPEQREAIRLVVVNSIQNPHTSVAQVAKQLSKYFDAEMAQIIAVTEITRMHAHTVQIEGAELASQYPGVLVVKKWFVSNDEQVCPGCKQLAGKEVAIDGFFAKGVFLPPAHPGCRCWIDSKTRI